MAYPYTNEEIQQIADTVAGMLFGWIVKGNETETDRSSSWGMIADWSRLDSTIWEAWSMYGEKYCPLAESKGLCRDMLSEEQRAIVCVTIKQTLSRATDVLRQHPEYEADQKKVWKRLFPGGKGRDVDRDGDLARRLRNARNHEF